MAKAALWPGIRATATIALYAGLTLWALVFADERLGRRGLAALHQLYTLARLPERPLGQTWTSPGYVRGTLHTAGPRETPSGNASAIWYAWVDDVRGSGRSSYTVTVCAQGEDEALELRQAAHTARLALFDEDTKIALLKGGSLEKLPFDRVALDFGELHSSRSIPLPMRQRCAGKLPSTGNLTYFEVYVPPGRPVTVLGCASAGAVRGCGVPPGVITVRGLQQVLRAYANQTLDSIRGAAAFVGIALSLLASALFKLRAGTGDPA